jgi:nitrite reductase/ring-hydroxylating ferredoxin subunit
MLDFKKSLLFGFCAGVLAIHWYQNYYVLYATILIYAMYSIFEGTIQGFLEKNIIMKAPVYSAGRSEHDRRRGMTYPDIIANSWYHLCDSSELVPGKVIEVRALGQVFAVWRTDEGKPVCQDAFCLHLGANLAVGGKVVDNCIECPFHKWKFSEDGTVKEIPYIEDPKKCSFAHDFIVIDDADLKCNFLSFYIFIVKRQRANKF